MNLFFKITKWVGIGLVCVVTPIMLGVAALNVGLILNLGSVDEALPHTMDDLQKIEITVKSALLFPINQYIAAVEYPTTFSIPGQLPREVIAKNPINAGDHVGIYLTKDQAQILEEKSKIPGYLHVYGIALQNGQDLVDPNQFLNGKLVKHFRKTLAEALIYPTIYFFGLIAFWAFRKIMRRSKQSN
jgi:hypothetical protein